MAHSRQDFCMGQTAELLAAIWNGNMVRMRKRLWTATEFYRPAGAPRRR